MLFSENIFGKTELQLLEYFKGKGIPVLLLHNKSDIMPLDDSLAQELNGKFSADVLEYSCNLSKEETEEEQSAVAAMLLKLFSAADKYAEKPILDGFVKKNDIIVLVCPIDSQAPEKRLILPQVMAIRDILDNGGEAVVLQPSQLPDFMNRGGDVQRCLEYKTGRDGIPRFLQSVNKMLPKHIPLTSFSILMARAKGPVRDLSRTG